MPPSAILKRLIRREKDSAGRDVVAMPAQAFQKLLETALTGLLDEATYLRKHADVRAAFQAGTLPSALRHYASDGYFEGRAPLSYEVDEAWYLKTYPDVADAIQSGKVTDAAQHFELFGFNEGRVPNRDLQRSVGEWRELERKASQEG